jgi:2-haloacid dehalogenase
VGRVLVFDVNETLLDVSALDDAFEEVFGTATVRREWFARLLHLSTVLTTLGKYVDFADLGRQALEIVATGQGVELDSNARENVLGRMRALPPHVDVVEGLALLAEAGFRMAALTNSGMAVARAQLDEAGIADYFTEVFSVETTGHFKPHAAPYRDTAERLGVDIGTIRLVAAHDWDCAGALAAGALAAWVARPGMAYADALAPPDLQADDLPALARAIISADEPE